jgi:hypothetical protein
MYSSEKALHLGGMYGLRHITQCSNPERPDIVPVSVNTGNVFCFSFLLIVEKCVCARYYPNVCQELWTKTFQSAVTAGYHLQTFEVQNIPDLCKQGQKTYLCIYMRAVGRARVLVRAPVGFMAAFFLFLANLQSTVEMEQ